MSFAQKAYKSYVDFQNLSSAQHPLTTDQQNFRNPRNPAKKTIISIARNNKKPSQEFPENGRFFL